MALLDFRNERDYNQHKKRKFKKMKDRFVFFMDNIDTLSLEPEDIKLLKQECLELLKSRIK